MKREGKLNRLQRNMLLVAAGLAVIAGGMIALNPSVLFKSNADVTGSGMGFAVFPKADGIILKFKSEVTAGNRTEVLQNLGLTERACIKEIDTCIYNHNAKKDALEEVVDRARIDSHIQFAEENRVVPASFTDNKPDNSDIPRPTPPSKTNPLEAWKTATGKGVTVAIISSGVDESHKQLGVRQGAEGYNFIAENASTNDKLGFGTALAGVILANSTDKFAGMAPDATYMPLKVTGNETTDGSSTLWNISRALVYAGNKGAKVAAVGYDIPVFEGIYCKIPSYNFDSSFDKSIYKNTLSYEFSTCLRRYVNPSKPSSAFSEATRYLKDKGGVTVTSATVPKNSTEFYNNEYKDPYYTRNIIQHTLAANIMPEDGVAYVAGAHQNYPKVRTFTNFSTMLSSRLVATTTLGNKIDIKSGAGMAVGHFAGVMALMREANPNLKADQLVPTLCSLSSSVDQGYIPPRTFVQSLCQEVGGDIYFPSHLASFGVIRAKQASQSGTKILNAPSGLDASWVDQVSGESAMFKVRVSWSLASPNGDYSYELYRGDKLVTKSVTQSIDIYDKPSDEHVYYDYAALEDSSYNKQTGTWSVTYTVKAYDMLGNTSPPASKTVEFGLTGSSIVGNGYLAHPPFYLPYNVSITSKTNTSAELSFIYPKQLIDSKKFAQLFTKDVPEHQVCYMVEAYTGDDNFRKYPSTAPTCMKNPIQGELNSFHLSGLEPGKLYQYWIYERYGELEGIGFIPSYQSPLTSMFRTASVGTKETRSDLVPKNILVTPASDGQSATLYWTTDTATTAEAVYDIATSADGKTVGDPHKTVADNVKQTKHTVTLKTNSGLKYYYKIFSYADKVAEQSDLLNFTAKGSPDLSIVIGKFGTTATVSWTPSSEVTYDVVYATTRSKDGSTVGDPHQTINSNTKTKTPSATLPGLTPNTTYFVKAISYTDAPALDWSGCVDGRSSITGDGKSITVKNEKGSAIGKHSDCRKLNNTEILGKFSYSGNWNQCKSVKVATVTARGKVEVLQSAVPFTVRFDDPQGGPSIYTIKVTCPDNATIQSALQAFTTSGDVK